MRVPGRVLALNHADKIVNPVFQWTL